MMYSKATYLALIDYPVPVLVVLNVLIDLTVTPILQTSLNAYF